MARRSTAADGENLSGGTLSGVSALTVSGTDFVNAGKVIGGAGITFTLDGDLENRDTGTIQATTTLIASGGIGTLTNAATMTAGGAATITATTVDNKGGAQIVADDTVGITADGVTC